MPNGRIVETASGKLQGTPGTIHRYLGIPYSAAPIGELRWKPPVAATPWSGVRQASTFGGDSFQQPDIQLRGSGLSEDCLYLNVWTSADDAGANLPVMVWIHGNGYTRGSGSHNTYDGGALASRGVVVVTLNYRLGLAGFLAHPELTAESEHGSSGNYGLLDQIAALRWVQENIRVFGGDPSRVTVFAQSAGATCSQLLMASPLTEGLFAQAILHSPGSMRPMATLSQAESAGTSVGRSINDLRQLSINALWPMASLLVPAVRRLASPRGMGPIVDGWIVRGDDISNYRAKRVRSMPVMVGVTANEGRRLTERMPIRTASEVFKYLANSFGSERDIPSAYLPKGDDTASSVLDLVVGDTQFNYGAWSIGEEMRSLGGNVFRYTFRQPIPGSDLPPTHDDELPYVFGTLETGNLWRGATPTIGISEDDRNLSQAMGNAWTSFARDGNPSSSLLPTWPVSVNAETMVFDATPHVQRAPASAGLHALKQYFGH